MGAKSWACLFCGARMKPRTWVCPHCKKAAVPRIADRFEQRRHIRRGSDVVALEAFDHNTGAVAYVQVALPGASAAVRQALTVEARILQEAAGKAGFPALLGAGPVPQTRGTFSATEWVHGKPLGKTLRRGKITDKLELFKRVLEPLAHLHAMGKVHSALTLQSFCVAPGNRPVLFGLKHAQPAELPADRTGMRKYRAPEQRAVGQILTPATDVYACGVMLHRWLTGRFPRGLRPRAASKRNRRITPDMDAFIAMALASDPTQRFPSAAEMYMALQYLLGPKTVVDPAGHRAPSRLIGAAKTLGNGVVKVSRAAAMALICTVAFVAWLAMQTGKAYVRGISRLTGASKPTVAAATGAAVFVAAAVAFAPVRVSFSSSNPGRAAIAPAADSRLASPARTAGVGMAAPVRANATTGAVPPEEPQVELLPLDLQPDAWLEVHTWPPAAVYVDDQFAFEAPDPDFHAVPPGERMLTLVARTAQQRRIRLTLHPGSQCRVLYSFETDELEVREGVS